MSSSPESNMAAPTSAPPNQKRDYADIAKAIVSSEAFWPGVVILVGLVTSFWWLIVSLNKLYFGSSQDGYYSHGPLIPIISGIIISRNWKRIKDIPVKPFWPALVLLLPVLYLARASQIVDIQFLTSILLVAAVGLSIWFVAGGRWFVALLAPTLYLLFGLPIFTSIVEIYTNPLQVLSTSVSVSILRALGFQALQTDATTVYLDHFTLSVEVPCSGLKLVIAVSAFMTFFVLVGRLNWWKNLIMLSSVIPLCLFINGLRIALIGIVGDTYGADAGHQFHDYSGYITLVVCFIILFKLARLLGWKD